MGVVGPATVVSVAYVDPGNFGANLEAGMRFGLGLLWVVWVSGLLAVAVQYVAGAVGIARGRGVLELVGGGWRPFLSPVLLAVLLATDMAEYVGVIAGLHLLLGLPISAAALLGFVDVAILAALADRRDLFAKVIGGMVAAIGLSFVAELFLIRPDPASVLAASFLPSISGDSALVAAAIVGATIMPHAVVLHSHLAPGQSRGEHGWQTLVNMLGASAINASILITSAYALGGSDVTLFEVPRVLEPLYGPLSAILFSLALLLSGVASSAVSVEFGVVAVKFITGRGVEAWRVRLGARLANLAPAVLAMGVAGLSPLSVLVYTQAVLAAALPVVLVVLWRLSGGVVSRWLRLVVAGAAAYSAALVVYSLI
ncbi:Nramp family divalent metal transporter [Pyrobaculum ferrireducens]|uniref:Nramp family divalent metal transporter n=1 Tax=Pyrobaculum ferrireducens TaxID=1104324 RepID=UPI001EFFB4A1|nr:Nramp family divalent metal transporter [Pyrobaculum ferrireducens]